METGHELEVGVEGSQEADPLDPPTKDAPSPSADEPEEHVEEDVEHADPSEQDIYISEEEREIALFAKEDLTRYGCEFAEIDEKLRFSQRWDERQQLLYELRDNAIKTDPRVLRTLRHVARNDDNINLRMQAAEVLIHVGLQGIPEQIWQLSNDHWHTRLDALTTLERGAAADDEGVLAAFGTTLLDSSATVRARAIQVLITLATERKKNLRAGEQVHRFPEFVVYRLVERLQDTDSNVRQMAVNGIVEVAVEGDSYVIQALSERMQSASAPIRKSATEAMQRLALKFNEVNTKELRERDPESSPMVHIQRLLLHEDAKVQRSALVALEGLSKATNSLYTATSEVVDANTSATQPRLLLQEQGSAGGQNPGIGQQHAEGIYPVVPISIRRRGVGRAVSSQSSQSASHF